MNPDLGRLASTSFEWSPWEAASNVFSRVTTIVAGVKGIQRSFLSRNFMHPVFEKVTL
jgi:hypothetical protein